MAYCEKCGKEIDDKAAFCPYCGVSIELEEDSIREADVASSDLNLTKESEPDSATIKKTIPKKNIKFIILGAVVGIILLVVIISEINISKAKSLYFQGEYFKAGQAIKNVPSLGREDLIRIKTAQSAGWYYSQYMTTKRIRLSSGSSKSEDAYKDAFWELTFGLHIDLKDIDSFDNEIEKDEYQKFINMYYDELKSMFGMSKTEADELMTKFKNTSSVDSMKSMAYDWLEDHFF